MQKIAALIASCLLLGSQLANAEGLGDEFKAALKSRDRGKIAKLARQDSSLVNRPYLDGVCCLFSGPSFENNSNWPSGSYR